MLQKNTSWVLKVLVMVSFLNMDYKKMYCVLYFCHGAHTRDEDVNSNNNL